MVLHFWYKIQHFCFWSILILGLICNQFYLEKKKIVAEKAKTIPFQSIKLAIPFHFHIPLIELHLVAEIVQSRKNKNLLFMHLSFALDKNIC